MRDERWEMRDEREDKPAAIKDEFAVAAGFVLSGSLLKRKATSAATETIGVLCGPSVDGEEFDLKGEISVGRNGLSRTARSIRKVRGDPQHRLFTECHPCDSHIPSCRSVPSRSLSLSVFFLRSPLSPPSLTLDDALLADGKDKGLVAVAGTVKLGAVGGKSAHVMDRHDVSGLGLVVAVSGRKNLHINSHLLFACLLVAVRLPPPFAQRKSDAG